MKRCHAGFVEWVLPLESKQGRIGILFMGPFRGSMEVDHAQAPSVVSRQGELPCEPSETLAVENVSFYKSLSHVLRHSIMEYARLDDTELSRKQRIELALEEHYALDFSLVNLAELLHLSESRISQILRSEFGASFSSLLQRVRLRHAKERIQHTELSLAQIAQSCGFKDPSYFYRVFHKAEGITAGEFRKSQLLIEV